MVALWREIEITIDQILRPLAPAAVDAFAPAEPMPNVYDLAMQPIDGHPDDRVPESSIVLINPNQGADANAQIEGFLARPVQWRHAAR
ncbi:hypothetical protein [Defluviicoccus vanus]|uniref:Uncharacterized protein n=1 Tax=Defluviicoccus vanus TaxID=111831 RepID=A0A7H1MYD8_9PROT|nr:hypothetical protein [Defluviicoccus vanus]QNT68474.1 hypothetical protein HQ394_02730 [Defluviicoccus vanus]